MKQISTTIDLFQQVWPWVCLQHLSVANCHAQVATFCSNGHKSDLISQGYVQKPWVQMRSIQCLMLPLLQWCCSQTNACWAYPTTPRHPRCHYGCLGRTFCLSTLLTTVSKQWVHPGIPWSVAPWQTLFQCRAIQSQNCWVFRPDIQSLCHPNEVLLQTPMVTSPR